jgi:hypothetical protein
MTERIGYKLNPNKLKKAPQSILPYVVGKYGLEFLNAIFEIEKDEEELK